MPKAFAVPSITRTRVAGLIAALVAASLMLVGAPNVARADNFPGQDEIAAAKAAVSAAASSVGDLDAAVVQLEQALEDAQTAEAVAAELYAQALDAVDRTTATLADAEQRADEADAALEEARAALASVAQASYREGANLGTLGAVMTADGFDSAVTSSEVLSRASNETSIAMQRVEAAELVASTMRAAAEEAAIRAAEAETAAKAAFADAEDAATAAEQAVADADATRDAAVARLAELRGTTAALERERQAGLANERDRKRREAADEAIRDAEKESGGSGGSGGSGSGDSGSGDSGSGDSGSGDSGSGDSGSGDSGSGDSGSGGSGSGTGGTGGGGTEQPAPEIGGWRSSASDGLEAVAKGKTLVGYPYKLGGNSLAGFDCSWLTMTSWKAAGYSIPRSSQLQYNALAKVPLSKLRPGDLVFYGTDRNSSKIYHVALYIGGGKVVEAARPGKDSLIRGYDEPWRIDNLIPYAGRP